MALAAPPARLHGDPCLNWNSRLARLLPPLAVIALLIAVWWGIVVVTESPIFPTPWAVVIGTLELAQDGTLW